MTGSQFPQQSDGEQGVFSQVNFADLYEQVLVGPLFRPWVDALLDDVGLRPGNRVLDVACGTGIVARVAKERVGLAGTVVGVDVNPQMLAVAGRIAPTIDWRQGDAGALPVRDGEEFDVVVCQQGCQFFPDLAAAARQMHRAAVRDGRLGVSTWRPDDEFPFLRQLRRIAEEHVGPIDDRRHALGDPGRLEIALRDAGFRDVWSRRLARTIRFDDGASFVRLNAMALVAMSAGSPALGDAERHRLVAAIIRDSAQIVSQQVDDRGFAYEIATNVTLALA